MSVNIPYIDPMRNGLWIFFPRFPWVSWGPIPLVENPMQFFSQGIVGLMKGLLGNNDGLINLHHQGN